jgi:hypothetical protein
LWAGLPLPMVQGGSRCPRHVCRRTFTRGRTRKAST